jgi:hypothetical protein
MRTLRFLLLLTLCLAPLCALAQSTAAYRVTFESTWSAETHPEGFPSNPHFSGLIGAIHSDAAALWATGELASDGIEDMAETGSKAALRAEVEALVPDGHALTVLDGGGIGLSPGSVTLDVEVTEDFSLLSLVSMLAPSPDWFVGVAGLDLREGGQWVDQREVSLYVYDAGTDSGPTYTSPDEDTVPPEPIARIETAPFLIDGDVAPVGTFTFTLLSATDAEDAAPAAAFALDAPAPNPAVAQTALRLHLDRSQSVRVDVFDVLGRRVVSLHGGSLPAGSHGFTLDVQALPSGVYFVRARGAGSQATRRFVVR